MIKIAWNLTYGKYKPFTNLGPTLLIAKRSRIQAPCVEIGQEGTFLFHRCKQSLSLWYRGCVRTLEGPPSSWEHVWMRVCYDSFPEAALRVTRKGAWFLTCARALQGFVGTSQAFARAQQEGDQWRKSHVLSGLFPDSNWEKTGQTLAAGGRPHKGVIMERPANAILKISAVILCQMSDDPPTPWGHEITNITVKQILRVCHTLFIIRITLK